MSIWKLLLAVIVVGAVALFAFDAVSVVNARRDVSDAASASADAAAGAISSSKNRSKAAKIAESTARAHGDVVTAFAYDPVAARVKVTVSGSANSLVLHYFDKNLTNNIKASATAQPG